MVRRRSVLAAIAGFVGGGVSGGYVVQTRGTEDDAEEPAVTGRFGLERWDEYEHQIRAVDAQGDGVFVATASSPTDITKVGLFGRANEPAYNGAVTAYDDNGSQRWQTTLGARIAPVETDPLWRWGDGLYVLAGTNSVPRGGPTNRHLQSLSTNGVQQWETESFPEFQSIIGVDRDAVYFARSRYAYEERTDGTGLYDLTVRVESYGHDGDERWTNDITFGDELLPMPDRTTATGELVDGTLVLRHHNTTTDCGDTHVVTACDASTGDTQYTRSSSSWPRTAGDLVFVTTFEDEQHRLAAIDGHTGTERWQHDQLTDSELSGVIETSAGLVALTGEAVFGLDRTDGATQWQLSVPNGDEKPTITGVTDRLVALTAGSTLRLIDVTDGTERWQLGLPVSIGGIQLLDDGILATSGSYGAAIEIETGALQWTVTSSSSLDFVVDTGRDRLFLSEYRTLWTIE